MRRKVTAGYPRGEETRKRILDVALSLIGTKGYDAVSTREIAVAAGVPAPSLRYYFSSKEGLYIACLDHIQVLSQQVVEPALLHAEQLLQDNAEIEHLVEAYCNVQQSLIEFSIGGKESAARSLFMIRHDLPSESGTGLLTGEANNPLALRLLLACTEMLRRISGNALTMEMALIVGGLINGQVMAIQIGRTSLEKFGWDITPERLQWLKRTIGAQTRILLLAQRELHSQLGTPGAGEPDLERRLDQLIRAPAAGRKSVEPEPSS